MTTVTLASAFKTLARVSSTLIALMMSASRVAGFQVGVAVGGAVVVGIRDGMMMVGMCGKWVEMFMDEVLRVWMLRFEMLRLGMLRLGMLRLGIGNVDVVRLWML